MASILRSSGFRSLARVPTSRAFSTTSHLHAAATNQNDDGSEASFFWNEPNGPRVQTAIPGTKTQEAIADLGRVYDTRSVNLLADYDKSLGN